LERWGREVDPKIESSSIVKEDNVNSNTEVYVEGRRDEGAYGDVWAMYVKCVNEDHRVGI